MKSRAFRRPTLLIGGGVFALLVAAVLIGPLIWHSGGNAQDLGHTLEGPSLAHPMGYDQLGRDLFTRVLLGGRISLGASLLATGVGFVLGIPWGIIAGSSKQLVDDVLMRTIDVVWAFPGLLLALCVSALLGPGVWNAALAVGISLIPEFARLARAATITIREMPYVESARAIGHTYAGILWHYIAPNMLAPVLTQLVFRFGTSLLTIAGLSFIGLGAQPPTPEWGALIADGRMYIFTAAHVILGPGLVVAAVVVSVNLLGDSLRDMLDPRLRGKVG